MIEALNLPPEKRRGNPCRTRGGERLAWSLSLGASRFGGSLEVWKRPSRPVDADVERFGGSLEVWKPSSPPPCGCGCGACMFLSLTAHFTWLLMSPKWFAHFTWLLRRLRLLWRFFSPKLASFSPLKTLPGCEVRGQKAN